MAFLYRVLAAAFGAAVGKTLLLILAAFGIDIPQRIADAVVTNATPGILSSMAWAILALLAFTGLLLGPKIEELVWSITKPATTPLTDLLREAARRGVSFAGKDLDTLALADGFRQAGLDGAISFYGQQKRYDSAYLNENEPLQLIPSEHWKDFKIDANTLRKFVVGGNETEPAEDNKLIVSYNPSQRDWYKGGYADLHVNTVGARRWLRRNIGKIKAVTLSLAARA